MSMNGHVYALFISVVYTRICIFHSVIPVGFGIICIGFCNKRNYAPVREGKSQHTHLETIYNVNPPYIYIYIYIYIYEIFTLYLKISLFNETNVPRN